MAQVIKVPTIVDERGALTVIDNALPFEIKRIFYLYDTNSKRGGHGHKFSTIAIVAIGGSVEVKCQTPDKNLVFRLSSPDVVLILNPEDWHILDKFSEGSIILVLSSHHFDKDDYFYEKYRD